MKKLLLSLGILFLPLQVFAGAGLLQILVFDWNTETEKLKLRSLGSGTAIEKNLVLTNKHVVQNDKGKVGDFLLLCQAEARQTRRAGCKISAGVVAVHPQFDVALVRTIDSGVFLPKVKVSKTLGYLGQSIRIIGFPAPVEGVQNFGGLSATKAIDLWLKNPTKGLNIEGDTPTTTRGKVLARARVRETGEKLLYTDARVNFGNSGGAAFDQFGRYIGIPSFMDKDGNAFILEYGQVDEWVSLQASKKPSYTKAAQVLFSQSQGAQKNKTSRWNRGGVSYSRKNPQRYGSLRPIRKTTSRYSRYKNNYSRNNTSKNRFNYHRRKSNITDRQRAWRR